MQIEPLRVLGKHYFETIVKFIVLLYFHWGSEDISSQLVEMSKVPVRSV